MLRGQKQLRNPGSKRRDANPRRGEAHLVDVWRHYMVFNSDFLVWTYSGEFSRLSWAIWHCVVSMPRGARVSAILTSWRKKWRASILPRISRLPSFQPPAELMSATHEGGTLIVNGIPLILGRARGAVWRFCAGVKERPLTLARGRRYRFVVKRKSSHITSRWAVPVRGSLQGRCEGEAEVHLHRRALGAYRFKRSRLKSPGAGWCRFDHDQLPVWRVCCCTAPREPAHQRL